MHLYHAKQVDQGCTHLQQLLELRAILHHNIYHHHWAYAIIPIMSNMISYAKCSKHQCNLQLIQPQLARQPVHCPLHGFEWLTCSPTLLVTPYSRYNHSYTAQLGMKSSYALFSSTCAMQCQSYIPPIHAALRQAASMLCLPLARTVHQVKRAQFPLPCQSAHTMNSNNLLLYFEGTFATWLLSMSLAS